MPKPKHRFDTMHRDNLPADVKLALGQFRNDLRRYGSGLSKSKYPIFENVRPAHRPLPRPDVGCDYREVQVGRAREDDPTSTRGRRRLVIEVNAKSSQIRDVYFTDCHYSGFVCVVPRPKV